MKRVLGLVVLGAFGAGVVLASWSCAFATSYGPPPPARPHRIKGAEGFPRLPMEHEVFGCHYDPDAVEYTDVVRAERPGFVELYLEGSTIGGRLVVLYSRYALGNGWEQIPHPHTRGVESKDALLIGVNAIIYSMTH